LNWHNDNGKNQSNTARHWAQLYPHLGIKQPLISSWVKDEEKWRLKWEEAKEKGRGEDLKRVRQVENPEVDEMLELWVTKTQKDKVHLSGEILRQKWTQFADMCDIPADKRVKLSDGWLRGFKKHCGLRELKRHGEAGSADPAAVQAERVRVQKILEKYPLRNIFNMDETGLYWAYVCRLRESDSC
jgi:hypothetical protein